jgi:hypothetical protein
LLLEAFFADLSVRFADRRGDQPSLGGFGLAGTTKRRRDERVMAFYNKAAHKLFLQAGKQSRFRRLLMCEIILYSPFPIL